MDLAAPAKVFGIGFHKTGTTSLGAALEFWRYRVCHGAQPLRDALGHQRMMAMLRARELDPILDEARHFDAFEDNPWFSIYREADARFPGSRFILTIRDDQRWLESAVRYFGRTESDFRHWIYGVGSPVGHEQLWLDRYRRHNDEVRAYFRDRPDDLLIINWEEGGGWRELSRFLGRPEPAGPFPHLNRRSPAL